MLKLFQSLFAREASADTPYPETLIDEAIERAVAATDSRLTVLSGYRKRLRAPVLHAVDHVVRMVDGLAPPVAADSEGYRNDALLGALFASPERMVETLSQDGEVIRALATLTDKTAPCFGLLIASMSSKQVFGVDDVDGQLRQDVQQTVISFDEHRLVDVCADEGETRRALKRRAFDHLLAQVLAGMEGHSAERSRLTGQQKLLRRKYLALQQAGWSFDAASGADDRAGLERRLQDIEAQLQALGSPADTLASHLELLASTLGDAQHQFWLQQEALIMDLRHIRRDALTTGAREIPLQRLCDARGASRIVTLLRFDPAALPTVDFFAEKAHYLR